VDLCETQEEAAYAMNSLGPKYLAEAAKKADAVFVQVSTDYVFSGKKEGAYLEDDETDPQSVYGKTKLAGEEFTKAAGGRYFIVRTAWLYGEGKNFVRTMLNLAKDHNRLTVVNDQTGTPTSTDELARAILFLADRKEYGIYHATCEGSVTWYGFAKKIFEYAGKEIEVVPVTSEEYKTAAERPKNSVLENRKLNALSGFRMKDWQSALKEYLKEQDC
jgi:dTDP-4-dehydrorhamnose reductase